jgi:hypothetical protein
MENNKKTEFIKEPENETKQFIFQKNKITKTGALIIIGFLALIIGGIYLSGIFLEQ